MEKSLDFGVIADDFTGASDAASFLRSAGVRTILFDGVPEGKAPPGFKAAVIALKTRTIDAAEAVNDSLKAARWLRGAGASRLYFKYCSTFDSRPAGNIGPVADALLEETGAAFSLLCPSLPVNGRTVRDGALYINGVPLHESPMKNHPLTPMWASSLAELMKEQSRWPCLTLRAEATAKGEAGIAPVLARARALSPRFYLVPDYWEDEHADEIAKLFGNLPLITGGSGLLAALGKLLPAESPERLAFPLRIKGRALLLAGSCSVATLAQIKRFIGGGGAAFRLSPEKLRAGTQTPESLLRSFPQDADAVLVYSSDTPEGIARARDILGEGAEAVFEGFFASLASLAVPSGFSRITVAGGETSGAVTKALHLGAFEIGESAAPGVPVLRPAEALGLRLILKSGNFGAEDFFETAAAMTRG